MKNNIAFAIIFVLNYSHIASQDIPRTIYSILNFHSHEIITPNDLNINTRTISTRFIYNDYYRKLLNDQKRISWDGNFWQIASWHCWFGERFKYGLETNIQFSNYDYQNLQDEKAVRLQNHRDLNSVNIQIAFSDRLYLLGGGMAYRKTKSNMPLSITEYPRSNNIIMNESFLDYLEPTFGNNLSFDGNSTLQNPHIFTTFPIYKKYQLTILYSYLYQLNNIDINYINSSNIAELTGNRSLDIPAKIKNSFIKTTLSKIPSPFQSSVTYFNTDINLQFNNILPSNYSNPVIQDNYKLGYFQGEHKGGSIELNYYINNYQLLLALGMGNLSGSIDLITPVLGRYGLPIQHGVKGQITGTNISENISINYNKFFKNIELQLFSSYTHGYYNLLVDGDAQLEFDLFSIPVYHPLNYHVHFFDFQGDIKWQIGKMNIICSFDQLIPIINRTDSSPIILKQETQTDYLSKHRGGSSYSICLQYNL